ncbi:MAG: IclR family transcriptional regulator, partial [Ferrovibrionaceae bacterium]
CAGEGRGWVMAKAKMAAVDGAATEESGGVRAVNRAIAILKTFPDRPRQSLAEVAEAARLDKGTTRRLLLTLMGEGFIVQDEATRQYGLGSAIRRIAAAAEDIDIRRIANPELTRLANLLSVTSFLSIYQNHGAVCLERMHDVKGMEVRWWSIGGQLPLNCGGAPKLLLAYQDEAEIEAALAGDLVQLTPKSVTDRTELRTHFAQIRKRGWELAIDDVALGLTALAVPIFNRDGAVVAALSIAGLTPQMHQRGKPLHLEPLQTAARTIAEQLD